MDRTRWLAAAAPKAEVRRRFVSMSAIEREAEIRRIHILHNGALAVMLTDVLIDPILGGYVPPRTRDFSGSKNGVVCTPAVQLMSSLTTSSFVPSRAASG